MDNDGHSSPSEEPPQKRQRLLACKRCRSRKQRCDDQRPCSNCARSGDECIPTEPAPRPHVESQYVRALEERIAELESHDPQQSLDHMTAPSNGQPPARPARRLTQSSGYGPSSASKHPTSASNSSNQGEREAAGLWGLSEAVDVSNAASGELASVSPANHSNARHSQSQRSPGDALSLAEDSDFGLDHLLYGLVASPSVRDDANLREPGRSPKVPVGLYHHDDELPSQSLIAAMPPEVEDMLLNAYRGRAQAQYPFFHWGTLLSWLRDWKTCPTSEIASRYWQGFFVNMVYSTALLLLSLPRAGQADAGTFYKQGISLLPHVLRQSDPVLHVQAYLVLSMHALHRSSTPHILSLASTTMRYCIQSQLHLAETEPEPLDPVTRLDVQVRRRCFWSAYVLDRLVMASFELPPSVPDTMITLKLYANIDDEELEAVAAQTPPNIELPDCQVYTCVSSSLHILQCRRIQSEISSYTLRWDYKEYYENATEWRVRTLAQLEGYKSRVQNFSDPQAKGHTSQVWLAMIYHYTLLLLYRPTKDSVLGPAGDWSMQASSQACLMFRKCQMDRQIAQAWLGLLVQFQCGVTMLYCCWATPPEYRTESYESSHVSDALRACSNILAIMADRWPKADCLRDVFELLAREVPLIDRPSRPPTRISDSTAEAIRKKLPLVRRLVVHRSIMRMVNEMITDDFCRLQGNESSGQFVPRITPTIAPRDRPVPPLANRQVDGTEPATAAFELPFATQQIDIDDGTGVGEAGMSTDELLAFPGMFVLDDWN